MKLTHRAISLFFILVLFSCAIRKSDEALDKKFVASDDSCSISTPNSWKTNNDHDTTANIQIGSIGSIFTSVWVEPKVDFVKMDLERLAKERFVELMNNTNGVGHSNALSLSVGGIPALQYQVHGQYDNLNIGFLYTILEGEKNYYRVLQWTLESQYESKLPIFQKMLQSFKGK